MALTLQTQLTFVEVDWDIKPLRDSSENVFRFMEDADVELPKGVMTMATRCYSSSCPGDSRCYASRCPYRTAPAAFLQAKVPETTQVEEGQVNRQTIIGQAIQSEIQYEADLTAMETLFISKLHQVIPSDRLDSFIYSVFLNAMELRDTSRRLIDHLTMRQEPQVGDIFLEAASEFRWMYPDYTGNVPAAELLLKTELEENPQFRLLNEKVIRENDRRRDIKYLVARPTDQLQRYPAVIEAVLNATEPDDPDHDFLAEALISIKSLSALSQLKIFHGSKGRGAAGKKQWYDLVPEEQRKTLPKKEQKRQM